MDNRSFPSKNTCPPVISYPSRPAKIWARVLLPEPLGPMMACTSPALTVRLIPLRISLSSTLACRFLISNISFFSKIIICVHPCASVAKLSLAYRPFQAHAQEFLCFDREFHGQFPEHF